MVATCCSSSIIVQVFRAPGRGRFWPALLPVSNRRYSVVQVHVPGFRNYHSALSLCGSGLARIFFPNSTPRFFTHSRFQFRESHSCHILTHHYHTRCAGACYAVAGGRVHNRQLQAGLHFATHHVPLQSAGAPLPYIYSASNNISTTDIGMYRALCRRVWFLWLMLPGSLFKRAMKSVFLLFHMWLVFRLLYKSQTRFIFFLQVTDLQEHG